MRFIQIFSRRECDRETSARETEVGGLIKSALLNYNPTLALHVVKEVDAHLLLMQAFLKTGSNSRDGQGQGIFFFPNESTFVDVRM